MSAARQALNNRRGFTLVEIVVAGGLLLVIIGITASLLLGGMGGYSRVARMDQAKQLGLAVYDFYQSQLTEATAVSLAENPDNLSESLKISSAGRLLYNNEDLYGGDMYGSFRLSVSHWAGNDYLLYLQVTVWQDEDGNDILDSGEEIFIKKSAFRINNLTPQRKSDADDRIKGLHSSEGNPNTDLPLYYARPE